MRISDGRKLKFSDLETEIQRAFFATEDDLEKSGFKFYAFEQGSYLFLMFFIPIVTTSCLFLYWLLSEQSSLRGLMWLFFWFLFISAICFLAFYREHKHQKRGSSCLLTKNELLYFVNKDLVYGLPLESLEIDLSDNDYFRFHSGSVSFGLPFMLIAYDEKWHKFLYHLTHRSPKLTSIIDEFIKKQLITGKVN